MAGGLRSSSQGLLQRLLESVPGALRGGWGLQGSPPEEPSHIPSPTSQDSPHSSHIWSPKPSFPTPRPGLQVLFQAVQLQGGPGRGQQGAGKAHISGNMPGHREWLWGRYPNPEHPLPASLQAYLGLGPYIPSQGRFP